MIIVKTLGRFEISDGTHILNDDVLRSDMLKKLVIYFITHREYPVSVQELSDALWREDEIENPQGALKNLMYRLRNLMKKHLGDKNYFITRQGSYAWNNEIEVDLDVERFEECCKLAKAEKVIKNRILLYEEAATYYLGRFFENSLDSHWIITLSAYYHSLYLDAVKQVAEYFMREEKYHETAILTSKALHMDIADEDLHYFYIMSLIKEHKYELAVKRYEEAVSVIYDTLGIRNPAKLQLVQQELLGMKKGTEAEPLEDIYDDMEEEDSTGVFFCGYPIFKEIYRLEVRKNARLGESHYLVLFTMQLNDGIKIENEQTKKFLAEKAMKDLEHTLRKVLRIGDVATRYSDSQFMVLLPTCTYESSKNVAERVIKAYQLHNKKNMFKIKTDFEQISNHSTLGRFK